MNDAVLAAIMLGHLMAVLVLYNVKFVGTAHSNGAVEALKPSVYNASHAQSGRIPHLAAPKSGAVQA